MHAVVTEELQDNLHPQPTCCCFANAQQSWFLPWRSLDSKPGPLVKTDGSERGSLRAELENRLQRMSSSKSLAMDSDATYMHQGVDITTLLMALDPFRPLNSSYEVVEKIGRGTFGTVWLSKSKTSGEERAIKMIGKRALQDYSSLLKEVEVLLRADHPNVVKLFEYFEDDNYLFLVTELMRGGDFADICMSTPNNTTMSEVQGLFLDVARALAYCHGLCIAHCDLKLENCMLVQRGHRRVAKVIDWGMATTYDQNKKAKKGTTYYAAPEYILGSITSWMACDIWAYGVLLYIVITGEHPFLAEANLAKWKQLQEAILKQQVRAMPLQQPVVVEALGSMEAVTKTFLHDLLQKDPSVRPDASRLISHEWMQEERKMSMEGNDMQCVVQSAFSQAMTFARRTRLERTLMTLLAYQTESREIEKLSSLFADLDIDGNGMLSPAEMLDGMKRLNVDIAEKDLTAAISAIDTDGNGLIQYTEWLAATMQVPSALSEQTMKDLFRYFDHTGSGSVALTDLETVLGSTDFALAFEAAGEESQMLSYSAFSKMLRTLVRQSKRADDSMRPSGSLHDHAIDSDYEAGLLSPT